MTKSVVEAQDIVVLKADLTSGHPEAEAKLVEFGNTLKAIPYYAVFRPDQETTHFDGNFLVDGSKGFLETAGISWSDNKKSGKEAVADASVADAQLSAAR